MSAITLPDLCRMLGKDAVYVRNLQRHLELHVPRDGAGYSDSYALFLEKVVALRAFHIPQDDIKELFETEKRILRLLHFDALTDSATWYLDGCRGFESSDDDGADQLLLTGYGLGFPIDAGVIQHTLDFGQRDPELFRGVDMGEDVRRILRKYVGLLKDIKSRIQREKPVLENALAWARRFLRKSG